jgi:hypothetical protein
MFLIVLIVSLVCVSIAWAFSWTSPTDLFDVPNKYDYSPSWMADTVAGQDRMWWCAARDGGGDVIRYSETTSGVWSTPSQVVLEPWTTTWEGIYKLLH